MHRRFTIVSAALLSVAALAAGGCTKFRTHQGYVVDQALVDSVAVGIDNKASVERTLGRPTFASQFGVVGNQGQLVTPEQASDWYYLSRNTRNFGFARPRAKEQMLLRVHFDALGNVTSVDKTGTETIVDISPNGDKTPTLGRDRSFFEELFGNIGAVGVPGAGAGGAGSSGG